MRKRLHIKVSRLCNNNCIFCLDDRPKRTDVTAAEVGRLLERASRLGEMLFTCGEPTLHPGLPGFVAMAREAGYRSIGIVTNGRRLAYPAYCEELLRRGVSEVTISIHGCNAAMHDAVTRARGSFDQTLAGLRNVSEKKNTYGVRLVTSTVLTRRNLGRTSEILSFLGGFGVDTMVLNVVEPSGEALRHFERLTPTYTEVSKTLGRAIQAFPERSRVAVEGIPLCLCQDFLDAAGIREEIHLLEGKKFKALPLDRFHVKVEACKGCRLSPRCPGIFRVYADRRGTSEINRVP
jgi:MoaA/NifB/PqqE/SkfB family radical SAM enzyme